MLHITFYKSASDCQSYFTSRTKRAIAGVRIWNQISTAKCMLPSPFSFSNAFNSNWISNRMTPPMVSFYITKPVCDSLEQHRSNLRQQFVYVLVILLTFIFPGVLYEWMEVSILITWMCDGGFRLIFSDGHLLLFFRALPFVLFQWRFYNYKQIVLLILAIKSLRLSSYFITVHIYLSLT